VENPEVGAVRMYLEQMSDNPLLSRHQEVEAAQRIELYRQQFRSAVLGTDFALRKVVQLLGCVSSGTERIQRAFDVSMTDVAQKRRIFALMGPNLRTLNHLLSENHRDFVVAIGKQRPDRRRLEAWRRMVLRRAKAVRLVEEFGLRDQHLQTLAKDLRQIS